MKIIEQQETGTCQKSVKIEIPRNEVDSELDEIYQEFIQHANVPGFRKGKVPKNIVKMRYGKHLRREAVGKAVENAFKEAMNELDLHPVSQPDLGDFDPETNDDPIVFEAKFEFKPEVEVNDYKSVKLVPPSLEVTEQQIVETLERLREQNAMYEPVDERPASENDYVDISCVASIDGEPFADASNENITLELGSGRYLPGFEDQLIGMKIGDEKDFELTLPDDYPDEEKRGKSAKFHIKLKQIREKKLPELDDEFAKDLGNFDNLDHLKDQIRQTQQQNMESRKEEESNRLIREELLKNNQFDVPPSMVKAQYNYINAVQDMEYRRMGRSLESMAQEDQGLLARNEQTAEEEVRLSLILDRIAKYENIEISDEDFNAYITRVAQASNSDPSFFKEQIESQGMESHYKRLALEEKVLKYLQSIMFYEEESNNDSES